VFLAVAACLLVAFLLPRATPATSPEGIAELSWVDVNGREQLLLQRGEDASAPVVLFLHGGPGVSVMPAARSFHAALEQDVVIAHWDQPGSATACLEPGEGLSLEAVVDDAEAVAEHLRREHSVEKIGLVGASWGSIVGLKLIQRRPELFWAYVGEGQVLNTDKGEVEALARARTRAAASGDDASLEVLASLEAPFNAPQQGGQLRSVLAQHGSIWVDAGPYVKAAGWMVWGREHVWREKLRYLPCIARASSALYDEIKALRLDETVSEVLVPAYIFQGRHDYLAPPGVVTSWAEAVPGVEVVWFEESGHVPSLEQPEEYVERFRRFVLRHASEPR